MTSIQQGVICLVKSALTGKPQPLPQDFQWDYVAAFLIRNGLSAMGYTGALLCGIPENDPKLMVMQEQYMLEFLYSERQLQQLEIFYQAMEENGLDYMPVKGAIMKALYPAHEMRNMGDADILFRESQKEQITPILEKLGYEFQSESDREWTWMRPELKLELHKRLVSTDEKTNYKYFGDGWDFAQLQEGHRYELSREDAFVFEFCHFTRHYCIEGIGVRHMIDLWVHLYTAPNMDQDYILESLQKLRLKDFYENVLRTLEVWFSGKTADACTDYITEYVFGGGKVSHSTAIAEAAVNQGKSKVFWRRVFPAKKQIIWNYPQYKKLPLPIAWVARWCSLMRHRDTVQTRMESMRTATDESVEQYRQSLAFVGLDVIE